LPLRSEEDFRGALESATAQPRMTFDDPQLYPNLPEKAAAPGFSLDLI
jgi:hypothetical protein